MPATTLRREVSAVSPAPIACLPDAARAQGLLAKAGLAAWDVARPVERVCRIGFTPLQRRIRHGIPS